MIRFCTIILALAMFSSASSVSAAQYFVDYAKGSDSNAGSATSPWKHCPGDAQTTGKVRSVGLKAGDHVSFKGGVIYRGSIQVSSSGSVEKPLVFDGSSYGEGRAVIDGSEIVHGWKESKSADDCGGNKNWKNILWAPLPKKMPADMAWNISQGDQLAFFSESHNSENPYICNRGKYRAIPASQATRSSVKDSELAIFAQGGLADAFIAVHCKPEVIYRTKITGYNAASQTLSFQQHKKIGKYYKEVLYNILNSPLCIDRAGEYAVDKQKGRIYFWPYNDVAEVPVSMSQRSVGIAVDGLSHVTIKGFKVQKYACGFSETGGNGISVKNSQHIQILDNKICINRTLSRQGVVKLYKLNKGLVANNHIYHNPFYRVVRLDGTTDTIVRNNFLDLNTGTGFVLYNSDNIHIDGNVIRDHIGIHSQGMAVYLGSDNVTIENNYAENGTAITLQASKNAKIHNNVFHGKGRGFTIGLWGGGLATADITNNTLIGAGTEGWSKGLSVFSNNSSSGTAYTLSNNVMAGASGGKLNSATAEGNLLSHAAKASSFSGNGNAVSAITNELAQFEAGNYGIFKSKGAQIAEGHGIHLLKSMSIDGKSKKSGSKKLSKKEQRAKARAEAKVAAKAKRAARASRAKESKKQDVVVDATALQEKLDTHLAVSKRSPRFYYSVVRGEVEIQEKSDDKYKVVVLKMGTTMNIDLFRKLKSTDAAALSKSLPN
ncbi:MAG: right-handed parallel beta-helix repeat-containing protein [Planctomycetes bacterium]|nr:right-handed parallel beta-helix repeat-containing protein [Planctomycetota bacterium]